MKAVVRVTVYQGETPVHVDLQLDGGDWQLLSDYLADAAAAGFSLSPRKAQGDLAEGEDSWPVVSYVVGEANKKGGGKQPVVWLYTGSGQFKHCSIYEEGFEHLWFKPDLSKVWPVAAAPNRQEAVEKGFMREVETRKVIRSSYTNAEGEKRRKFDRYEGQIASNGKAGIEAPKLETNPTQFNPAAAYPKPSLQPQQLVAKMVEAFQAEDLTMERYRRLVERSTARRDEVGESLWGQVILSARLRLAKLWNSAPKEKVFAFLESDSASTFFGDHYQNVNNGFPRDEEVPF